MKRNVGSIDRVVRILIGSALIGAGLFKGMWWAVAVGALIAVTGLIGWCGIYTVLGLHTCPTGRTGDKK